MNSASGRGPPLYCISALRWRTSGVSGSLCGVAAASWLCGCGVKRPERSMDSTGCAAAGAAGSAAGAGGCWAGVCSAAGLAGCWEAPAGAAGGSPPPPPPCAASPRAAQAKAAAAVDAGSLCCDAPRTRRPADNMALAQFRRSPLLKQLSCCSTQYQHIGEVAAADIDCQMQQQCHRAHPGIVRLANWQPPPCGPVLSAIGVSHCCLASGATLQSTRLPTAHNCLSDGTQRRSGQL